MLLIFSCYEQASGQSGSVYKGTSRLMRITALDNESSRQSVSGKRVGGDSTRRPSLALDKSTRYQVTEMQAIILPGLWQKVSHQRYTSNPFPRSHTKHASKSGCHPYAGTACDVNHESHDWSASHFMKDSNAGRQERYSTKAHIKSCINRKALLRKSRRNPLHPVLHAIELVVVVLSQTAAGLNIEIQTHSGESQVSCLNRSHG